MNPYLSRTGRLTLFTALVFMMVGIAAGSPIVLLVGQALIVLLAISFMALAPGALVLDRRLVSLDVRPEENGSAGTGHVVGDIVPLVLSVRNHTDHALHNVRVEPFTAEALAAEASAVAPIVRGGQLGEAALDVTSRRCGRWMLHGFDVRISDPLGLVESRDYLPCNHSFEFYPRAGTLQRAARSVRRSRSRAGDGLHVVSSSGSGTEIRQLRDWRSTDSLRDIAWKASLRARKLISREFEREVTAQVYIVLDVSSSMRGGREPGQKLDWAIHFTVDLAARLIEKRDRVGLVTFDEKLYGHIAPGNATNQLRRMLHHLVGLNSIVDEDLTEPDRTEIERLAADYLLVQDRLDFRRGATGADGAVNRPLLDKWLKSTAEKTRRELDSPALREGVVQRDVDPLRQFLKYRGVTVPYRVEARLGMKERGLADAIGHVVASSRFPHRIVVISDLCGVMKVESIVRAVNLARADGHEIEFAVPFTPWFYEPEPDRPKFELVRELFTSAEAEERARIVTRLRSIGVHVQPMSPRGHESPRRSFGG